VTRDHRENPHLTVNLERLENLETRVHREILVIKASKVHRVRTVCLVSRELTVHLDPLEVLVPRETSERVVMRVLRAPRVHLEKMDSTDLMEPMACPVCLESLDPKENPVHRVNQETLVNRDLMVKMVLMERMEKMVKMVPMV